MISFAFFGAFLLFRRPMDHYSYHSSPMIFTFLFSFSISFILLGFFCHWALLPKIDINNKHIVYNRIYCVSLSIYI